ncbi:MAG TPA: MltA domain-containing protein [Geobacteraceae bacterium]|nr:MltA domain-containing protein [Geobacteraceae bacterium]
MTSTAESRLMSFCIFGALFLSACSAPHATIREPHRQASPAGPAASPSPVAVASPAPTPVGTAVSSAILRPARWDDLPGWRDDDLTEAWPAWLRSCAALGKKPGWEAVCEKSWRINGADSRAVMDFFTGSFVPYQVVNPDETTEGLVTGYYEPIIHGDLVRTERARYPVYGVPPDLVRVDLSSLYPELKHMRLRGRVVDNRLVPYFSRAEIDDADGAFSGQPIAWVEDPVDLLHLQIQGSGRVELPTGERIRIGYADQNGHPFRSVARTLVERGEFAAGEASVHRVRQWGKDNPEKLTAALNENPSYVFFRRLPDSPSGPLGALGVPLTERRSIAVDPRHIPLGAPVFLSTSWPLSDRPLNRLMMAQDTGGAIRGAVRVDYFWGLGDEAGSRALRMKQKGKKWVILPVGFTPEVSIGKK